MKAALLALALASCATLTEPREIAAFHTRCPTLAEVDLRWLTDDVAIARCSTTRAEVRIGRQCRACAWEVEMPLPREDRTWHTGPRDD